jgi:MarR family transcriptional regulator, organic hydroperoxide resistance regulator
LKRLKGARAGEAARARSLGEVLSFLRLLWAIAHGLASISKRMRATVGVTGPQRLVIRLIGRYGKTAPGDLADVLHVHPSSLTGVLRRLEKAQLIKRTTDPTDGRRAILTLTPRGQALNDQALGTVESSVRRTLRGVPPAQVAIVRDVLATLARELGVDGSPVAGAGRLKRVPPARGEAGRGRRRRG